MTARTSRDPKPAPRTEFSFCDSCTNAASDEAGFELDPFSVHPVLFNLGADIADHIWTVTRSESNATAPAGNPGRTTPQQDLLYFPTTKLHHRGPKMPKPARIPVKLGCSSVLNSDCD